MFKLSLNVKYIIWAFLVLMLLKVVSYANNTDIYSKPDPLLLVEIPTSPNIIGSGARSLGMGGAFIAIADDATAASWNPGGLIRLRKPEYSAVLSYINRKSSNPFSKTDRNSTRMSVDDINLNYFSIAYPLNNRNMIVSLNYQLLFDFNRYFNFNFHSSDPSYIQPVRYDFKQKGNLYALGLAYSTKLSHNFWAGITVNYWGDFIFQNKWENSFNEVGTKILPRPPATNGVIRHYTSNYKEEFFFSGWNINICFLWRINTFKSPDRELRIGGIIKTPFRADIDYIMSTEYTQIIPKDPASNSYISNVLRFDTKLRMPLILWVRSCILLFR